MIVENNLPIFSLTIKDEEFSYSLRAKSVFSSLELYGRFQYLILLRTNNEGIYDQFVTRQKLVRQVF